jgi:lipoyl(octanoyl) transferase
MKVNIKYLGLQDYSLTYKNMQEFTKARNSVNNSMDEIWIVEHPAVYTLGQAGKYEHLLLNPLNIPVVKTDRGGQITYHGKGQIVAYMLLNLHATSMYVRELVFCIEQCIIETLADHGISGQRKESAPGIYVWHNNNLAKIAALGLKVSRGYTYHGLSLNVSMDLSYFDNINPCGYIGLKTIDMHAFIPNINMNDVQTTLVEKLCENLDADLN